MKQQLITAIILTLTVSLFSFAQSGNTGLAFLKLGKGSRALGMGEAFTAVISDPSAMNYNPSMLSLTSKTQAVFTHQEWFQSVQSEYFGITTHAGDFALGLGLNSVNIPDIEIRTTPGKALGTFDAKNVSIGATAAYSVTPDIGVGATVSYLYEKIYVDQAAGFGVNLGAWYATPWDVRLGFAVDHLGSMNALNTTESTLPTTIRFGGAYELPVHTINGTLLAAAEIVSIKEEGKAHLHLGAEYEYQQTFALRAGYQTGYETKDFSAGVGFKYSLFKFDYAFLPLSLDLGSSHTFTLGVEY